MSSHVIGIDIDVYSAFAAIFNILCLGVVYDSMRLFYWYLILMFILLLLPYSTYYVWGVAYDSMRLFYWYLHYIYDLILDLCIIYYTVCYLTGIFYAVVRQISALFIDNKISVFCILWDSYILLYL